MSEDADAPESEQESVGWQGWLGTFLVVAAFAALSIGAAWAARASHLSKDVRQTILLGLLMPCVAVMIIAAKAGRWRLAFAGLVGCLISIALSPFAAPDS